jgi:cbb3-type cytochrome oxidase cytochrome c subunit
MTITYQSLTHDSFQRKLKVFGLTLKNKKDIEKYPFIRLASDDIEYVDEVCYWCQQQFGDNWIWSAPSQLNRFYIYFLTTEDAFLCKLAFGEAPKQEICETA